MQTREQINADWRTGESNTDTNIRNILEVLLDIRDVICGKPLEVEGELLEGGTVECNCGIHKGIPAHSTNPCTCFCHHKKEEWKPCCFAFGREGISHLPSCTKDFNHETSKEEIPLPEKLSHTNESICLHVTKINEILEYLKAKE